MNRTISILIIVIAGAALFLAYHFLPQPKVADQPAQKMMVSDEKVTIVELSPQQVLAPTSKISISLGDASIIVDVAKTDTERSKGLSGRTSLSEEEGLFFVFPVSGDYSFWMKDMNFPIDIIWVNDGLEVISVEANALPQSYPKVFHSEVPARYVLEVSAGFAERHGVKAGTKLELGGVTQ